MAVHQQLQMLLKYQRALALKFLLQPACSTLISYSTITLLLPATSGEPLLQPWVMYQCRTSSQDKKGEKRKASKPISIQDCELQSSEKDIIVTPAGKLAEQSWVRIPPVCSWCISPLLWSFITGTDGNTYVFKHLTPSHEQGFRPQSWLPDPYNVCGLELKTIWTSSLFHSVWTVTVNSEILADGPKRSYQKRILSQKQCREDVFYNEDYMTTKTWDLQSCRANSVWECLCNGSKPLNHQHRDEKL